jgi:ribosome-associated protein
MKDGVEIKNGLVIPTYEIEISASRAGGPGGQHVNKTNSRITLRWNVNHSMVLSEEQKQRIREKLQSELTLDGDLIIHSSESRSQDHNRKEALARFAHKINKALQVPKKRMKSQVSKGAKEKRLQSKKQRSELKKMRSKKEW